MLMTLEEIQSLCHTFRAVTEDIKWEDHLCFNVGGKMFLITSPDAFPISAAFKVTEEDFDELSARDGFMQAPHFAKRKWLKVDDINHLSKSEWKKYLQISYNLVVAKLTKKLRLELDLL
jgi:predicted DNA-binding protein (MmcQ/YjbR family)